MINKDKEFQDIYENVLLEYQLYLEDEELDEGIKDAAVKAKQVARDAGVGITMGTVAFQPMIGATADAMAHKYRSDNIIPKELSSEMAAKKQLDLSKPIVLPQNFPADKNKAPYKTPSVDRDPDKFDVGEIKPTIPTIEPKNRNTSYGSIDPYKNLTFPSERTVRDKLKTNRQKKLRLLKSKPGLTPPHGHGDLSDREDWVGYSVENDLDLLDTDERRAHYEKQSKEGGEDIFDYGSFINDENLKYRNTYSDEENIERHREMTSGQIADEKKREADNEHIFNSKLEAERDRWNSLTPEQQEAENLERHNDFKYFMEANPEVHGEDKFGNIKFHEYEISDLDKMSDKDLKEVLEKETSIQDGGIIGNRHFMNPKLLSEDDQTLADFIYQNVHKREQFFNAAKEEVNRRLEASEANGEESIFSEGHFLDLMNSVKPLGHHVSDVEGMTDLNDISKLSLDSTKRINMLTSLSKNPNYDSDFQKAFKSHIEEEKKFKRALLEKRREIQKQAHQETMGKHYSDKNDLEKASDVELKKSWNNLARDINRSARKLSSIKDPRERMDFFINEVQPQLSSWSLHKGAADHPYEIGPDGEFVLDDNGKKIASDSPRGIDRPVLRDRTKEILGDFNGFRSVKKVENINTIEQAEKEIEQAKRNKEILKELKGDEGDPAVKKMITRQSNYEQKHIREVTKIRDKLKSGIIPGEEFIPQSFSSEDEIFQEFGAADQGDEKIDVGDFGAATDDRPPTGLGVNPKREPEGKPEGKPGGEPEGKPEGKQEGEEQEGEEPEGEEQEGKPGDKPEGKPGDKPEGDSGASGVRFVEPVEPGNEKRQPVLEPRDFVEPGGEEPGGEEPGGEEPEGDSGASGVRIVEPGNETGKPVLEPRDFVEPGDKPEGKPGDKPGDKPEGKPGDKPGDKPEGKPGDKPEGKPGDKPEGKPGDKPGDKPEGKPGDKPEGKPGDKPEGEPGGEPGGEPVPVNVDKPVEYEIDRDIDAAEQELKHSDLVDVDISDYEIPDLPELEPEPEPEPGPGPVVEPGPGQVVQPGPVGRDALTTPFYGPDGVPLSVAEYREAPFAYDEKGYAKPNYHAEKPRHTAARLKAELENENLSQEERSEIERQLAHYKISRAKYRNRAILYTAGGLLGMLALIQHTATHDLPRPQRNESRQNKKKMLVEGSKFRNKKIEYIKEDKEYGYSVVFYESGDFEVVETNKVKSVPYKNQVKRIKPRLSENNKRFKRDDKVIINEYGKFKGYGFVVEDQMTPNIVYVRDKNRKVEMFLSDDLKLII